MVSAAGPSIMTCPSFNRMARLQSEAMADM